MSTKLGVADETDPDDNVVVDVGLASTRYVQAANDPAAQAAEVAAQADEKARTTRVREVLILAGAIMALFALERIVGRSTKTPRQAASSSAITTAARAAAGGA